MKKKNTTTKVKLLSDGKFMRVMPNGSLKPLEAGKTDWKRLHNMTEKEITAAAKSDPDNPPMTKAEIARLRPRFPQVKKIREELGMTQEEFASCFSLSLAVVRDWEQQRCIPDQAARSLLLIVEHLPTQSMRALGTDLLYRRMQERRAKAPVKSKSRPAQSEHRPSA